MKLPFLQGIKNLIKWFPVIWNDRDWDHMYLLKMLEFKFSNMGLFFLNKGICVDHKKQADVCFQLSYLCQRLREDPYFNLAQGDKKGVYTKAMFIREDKLRNNDLHQLCTTLEKELFDLWD